VTPGAPAHSDYLSTTCVRVARCTRNAASRAARSSRRVRQGSVLFCGEHTSIDFQGFMEGGASEGRRAARELANLIIGD
jgi:monoamine oxidase